ncbi:MAG TPA: T9SS type A sorting domain-containing protein, partial [Cytophagaceae bacterium]
AKIRRHGIVGELEDTVFLHFIDTTGIIPQAPSITSFILVNADNNQDIRVLQNNDHINIAILPPLNIRVTGNIPPTGSVLFNVGTYEYYKTENQAPYSVYGDINGDFQPGYFGPTDSPNIWVYSTFLTATPFSGPNGSGVQGEPVTIEYNVSFNPGAMKISVYPNPTQSDLFVNMNGDETVELILYDMMGKTYYNGICSSSQAALNLEQLEVPKGYYFLKAIYPDNSTKVIQLLKN